MVLINVLVVVMMATAILAVIVAGDESDLAFTLHVRQAAEADAVLKGGELSAVAALRRDLAAGDASDGLNDEWAQIADDDAAIDGGRFSFAVSDAQARFNLNNLQGRNGLAMRQFTAIVDQLGLPPETVVDTSELIAAGGPLSDPGQLSAIGLTPEAIAELSRYATALPEPTTVNLNTASEELLAILTGSPANARKIVVFRERNEAASPTQLRELSTLGGFGASSRYFYTQGEVTIGTTRQRITSLLYRRTRGGGPEVLVLRRWKGATPSLVPPLP